MALPTCTRAAWITGGKCYTQNQWSQKEQDAIILFFMAQLLAAKGGTDYTDVMSTTLLDSANDLACGMSKDQREAALIYMLKTFSTAASLTTTEVATEIKCLKNATKEQIEQAKLYLLCQLATAFEFS